MKEVMEVIQKSQTIAILPHINPDGDALGSSLALYETLLSMGKTVYLVINEGGLDFRYCFLKFTDQCVHDIAETVPLDLAVQLDTPTKDRLGDSLPYFERATQTLNIDHHVSNIRQMRGEGHADIITHGVYREAHPFPIKIVVMGNGGNLCLCNGFSKGKP